MLKLYQSLNFPLGTGKVDSIIFEINTLAQEHNFFGFDTATGGITGKFTVGGNDPMARSLRRIGIGFHARAHCPGRFLIAGQLGDLSIRRHFAFGNFIGDLIYFFAK